MKVIAYYLPQFHAIPENDEWWGKGFTEWSNMKKAEALFPEHNQPRVPLNENYYNLLDPETLKWQANLAKKYGIYGFCFYHYWFDGHMLLEKPMEILYSHPEIDLNYCISWANEDWTNAWVSSNSKTLISQTYGDKDIWEKHFRYFVRFFKDKRYILIDGKPLLTIYRPELIPNLNNMLDLWQKMAIESGFKGLSFAYQHINFALMKDKDDSRFDFQIEYQPMYVRTQMANQNNSKVRSIKKSIDLLMQKCFHRSLDLSFLHSQNGPIKISYDEMWNNILADKPKSEKSVPGAFVDWDNTPRRGRKGSVAIGNTPEKFGSYFEQQICRAKSVYHKDMIFIFAWNEWAEGGYLEPDEKNRESYLNNIKMALEKTHEWPR